MRQSRQLRKLRKILLKVRGFQQEMRALSDEELAGRTGIFKARIGQGESLEDILPEAFAAICEADYRVLGKFPYDVQVLGAIALHQGMLAEMNTGEGKTLMATMPLYLNALSGKSTILVTTNEYLALRDAREMGQVYQFMGLSVAAGVKERAGERITNEEKKEIYGADIVYTTHSSLGFDYLLNHLVTSASERYLREFYYVIIDEADSVLLDSAQTPLVISGSPRVQSNLYELADFFVTTLVSGRDYEKEEDKVWLTREGIRYAEHFFQIENFYDEAYFEINRHVILALRAHTLFQIEKEYMITNSRELQLLDGGSGRMMPGVKLRGGQHQAIEAKEKLKISQESRSVASITFQNFFQLFPKMAGMSGTIVDAAAELLDVYHREVVVIPPNCPVRRVDLADYYYRDAGHQFSAAMATAIITHHTGQPVLIVVATIPETEMVSKRLVQAKIPHNVLNANNAFWEANIIKEAGQRNAMTVATAMAGRGTDIKLGEGVKELGGLAVIGIGRMVNIRQERQARGRAGRQGDPGSSRFFVSLQDMVVARNGPPKLEAYIEGRKGIGNRRLKRIIHSAQQTGEELAVLSRRQAMEYDQVLHRQRELMYAMRSQLLEGRGMDDARFVDIIQENIQRFTGSRPELDAGLLNRYLLDHISCQLDGNEKEMSKKDKKSIEEYLMSRAKQSFQEQKEKTGKMMSRFMRIAALKAIDEAWVEQVDYLQQMQTAVSGRAMAQRNPVFEFQKDGFESFQKMKVTILRNIMRNILLSDVYTDEKGQLHILLP